MSWDILLYPTLRWTDDNSNNIQSESMLRATTTKQLMDQSKLFGFLFWGSITSICLGVICYIVFPFTSCSIHSCSWYYSSTYECYNYGQSYCCSSYFQTYCGNLAYCWPKPTTGCIGWIIAGGTLVGLGFLLGVFVFILFCNYRGKIRDGTGYLKVPGQPLYPQFQQPIIIYSDQNHPHQYPHYQQYVQAQQQQQNAGNQINLSENQ